MDKVKELLYVHKKEVIFISSLILCLIAVFAFSIINNRFNAEADNNLDEIQAINGEKVEIQETINPEIVKAEVIKVDVKGAVNNPGVYELTLGSRVVDAINMAGGLKEDAYTKYLNFSKKLQDEFVVLVNTISEIEEIKAKSSYIEKETPICEKISNSCIKTENVITNSQNEKTIEENQNTSMELKKEDEKSSLININTALVEELATLEGIGESKAKAIVDYRLQNGPFEKIEDIMNVSGIGEKAYEKIKDNITT